MGDANRAYLDGDLEKAISGYERLVADGVTHEDVYYNLGNSYFRVGKLGTAIYNYERALDMHPGMADAVYNLEVARAAVATRIRDRLKGAEKEPWWVRVLQFLTISQLTVLVVVCNLLLFGLLVVLRFLESGFRRAVLLVLTSSLAIALLVSSGLLGGSIYLRESRTVAVVLPDQVVLREGIGDDSAERGQLHAGLRVVVIDRRGDWVLVRLSNGVDGWVEAKHVGVL